MVSPTSKPDQVHTMMNSPRGFFARASSLRDVLASPSKKSDGEKKSSSMLKAVLAAARLDHPTTKSSPRTVTMRNSIGPNDEPRIEDLSNMLGAIQLGGIPAPPLAEVSGHDRDDDPEEGEGGKSSTRKHRSSGTYDGSAKKKSSMRKRHSTGGVPPTGSKSSSSKKVEKREGRKLGKDEKKSRSKSLRKRLRRSSKDKKAQPAEEKIEIKKNHGRRESRMVRGGMPMFGQSLDLSQLNAMDASSKSTNHRRSRRRNSLPDMDVPTDLDASARSDVDAGSGPLGTSAINGMDVSSGRNHSSRLSMSRSSRKEDKVDGSSRLRRQKTTEGAAGGSDEMDGSAKNHSRRGSVQRSRSKSAPRIDRSSSRNFNASAISGMDASGTSTRRSRYERKGTQNNDSSALNTASHQAREGRKSTIGARSPMRSQPKGRRTRSLEGRRASSTPNVSPKRSGRVGDVSSALGSSSMVEADDEEPGLISLVERRQRRKGHGGNRRSLDLSLSQSAVISQAASAHSPRNSEAALRQLQLKQRIQSSRKDKSQEKSMAEIGEKSIRAEGSFWAAFDGSKSKEEKQKEAFHKTMPNLVKDDDWNFWSNDQHAY